MHRLLALASLSTCALAATAVASPPRKGATYRGATPQDRAIRVRVESDGRHVQLFFKAVERCSDGLALYTAVFRRQRPTVRVDGTFRYQKRYRHDRSIGDFGRGLVETQYVAGGFGDGGRTVRGAAEITLRSPKRHCHFRVNFSARTTS